jgi:hypothetical protein
VRHAVMIEGLNQREAARRFGIDPRTVGKVPRYLVPPGYVRRRPPVRPKLDPFIGVIDRIVDEDKERPKKQRRTSKRVYERLRDEYGFTGGITIVKDYNRLHRPRRRVPRTADGRSAGGRCCRSAPAWRGEAPLPGRRRACTGRRRDPTRQVDAIPSEPLRSRPAHVDNTAQQDRFHGARAAHPGARPTVPTATACMRPRRTRSAVGCGSCWLRSVRRWRVFRSGAGGDSIAKGICRRVRNPFRFLVAA